MEAGNYKFKLTAETAAAQGPSGFGAVGATPLEFEMQIERLDYRRFQGTGTMEMWVTDYQSPASVLR